MNAQWNVQGTYHCNVEIPILVNVGSANRRTEGCCIVSRAPSSDDGLDGEAEGAVAAACQEIKRAACAWRCGDRHGIYISVVVEVAQGQKILACFSKYARRPAGVAAQCEGQRGSKAAPSEPGAQQYR